MPLKFTKRLNEVKFTFFASGQPLFIKLNYYPMELRIGSSKANVRTSSKVIDPPWDQAAEKASSPR